MIWKENEMKQIYIPQGESRTFEQIVTETLVVEGHLNVIGSIKANSVSGNGVITAAEISADMYSSLFLRNSESDDDIQIPLYFENRTLLSPSKHPLIFKDFNLLNVCYCASR